MSPGDVAEGPRRAEFDDYDPIWGSAHGQACLEEYVWAGLWREFAFVWRVVSTEEVVAEAGFVITREKDYDGLSAFKGSVEYLRYRRSGVGRSSDCLVPLERFKREASEELE
jgi:hypothetical protein